MKSSMRAAVRSGMRVKLNLVIGFPHEGLGDILKTFGFLKDVALIGAHDAAVMVFTPYPGSELFELLEREGKIGVMDDEYFLALAQDVSSSRSYSPHLNGVVLTCCRLAGMLWFYGLSFALRPQRFFKLIRNIFSGQEESRLAGSLIQMRNRLLS
jgi:hypothetical protein